MPLNSVFAFLQEHKVSLRLAVPYVRFDFKSARFKSFHSTSTTSLNNCVSSLLSTARTPFTCKVAMHTDVYWQKDFKVCMRKRENAERFFFVSFTINNVVQVHPTCAGLPESLDCPRIAKKSVLVAVVGGCVALLSACSYNQEANLQS